jgi:hypothetical protein
MADPIPLLRTLPREIDKALVDCVKGLLREIEAGEVRDVAFAAVTREGAIQSHWHHSGEHEFGLVAAITRLAWRYQHEALDPLEQDAPPDGA